MKTINKIFLVAISFFLNFSLAQITETKLVPDDDTGLFGEAVSIDDNYAVIGTEWEDSLGSLAGAVYVFIRNGTSWTQQAKILASDGTTGDRFGFSVSIDGEYFIAGAFTEDEMGDNAGAAYIFHRDTVTGEWIEQVKLLASDGHAGDRFGVSVSMDGDYVIVGAQGVNNDTGAVYIFKREDTTWTEEAKFSANNSVSDALFGNTVSLSGQYAIIGAPHDEEIGHESGAAYIFHRDGVNWTQQEKLLSSDMLADDLFGYTVSISGDYAIVGAVSAWSIVTSAGAAYIFKRDGTTWTEQIKLIDSTAGTGYRYANSVYIDGDYALVGEPSDDDLGLSSGSAFIYKREGENWTKVVKLLASDGATGEDFGYSVCIRDAQIIVGAPFQATGGTYDGAAYVYNGFLTGINEDAGFNIPRNFILEQNYPNPFNPTTTIKYQLPELGFVTLKVYDVLGNAVATLVNKEKPAGEFEVEFDGKGLTSGVYFYQLKAGSVIETKKMVLLR